MSKVGRDVESEMIKMLSRYDEGLTNEENENTSEDQ